MGTQIFIISSVIFLLIVVFSMSYYFIDMFIVPYFCKHKATTTTVSLVAGINIEYRHCSLCQKLVHTTYLMTLSILDIHRFMNIYLIESVSSDKNNLTITVTIKDISYRFGVNQDYFVKQLNLLQQQVMFNAGHDYKSPETITRFPLTEIKWLWELLDVGNIDTVQTEPEQNVHSLGSAYQTFKLVFRYLDKQYVFEHPDTVKMFDLYLTSKQIVERVILEKPI